MSEPSRIPEMTIEEYLELEEHSTVRHEYIRGQVFAMTGATEAHNIICGNLFAVIHAHVRGTGCRAFINDMKVKVEPASSFYYPDIMVTCEPFEAESVAKCHPTLIIEVLSRSTKQIDRREKLVAYRQLSSLRCYVMVHQSRMLVELYRKCADGQWELSTLKNKSDLLEFAGLFEKPLQIPLNEVYGEVDLPSLVEESKEEELL
jgi:Uma2 family endonuclease